MWRRTPSKLTQTAELKMVCCTSVIHGSAAGRAAEYLQTGCPRSDPLRVFSLSALNELAWILTSQAGSALIGHRVMGEKGEDYTPNKKNFMSASPHFCFSITAWGMHTSVLSNTAVYTYCCTSSSYVLLWKTQADLRQVFNKSLYNKTAHYTRPTSGSVYAGDTDWLPDFQRRTRCLWLNSERHCKKCDNPFRSCFTANYKASVTAWKGQFVCIIMS